MEGMRFWDVYLDGNLVDSVQYAGNCDEEYVLRTLVEHDGYNSEISVKLSEDS